jgi:uncharacterized protein
VLLTTFRTTGVGVPTAVWVGIDGDSLIVTTQGQAGKVKRIRNNGRVELTPCDRGGTPRPGAATIEAHAEVQTDADGRARLVEVFTEKYGLAYKAIIAAGRLKRGSTSTSVLLRITV